MDPDLVRQQEEEEAASRLRALMVPPVLARAPEAAQMAAPSPTAVSSAAMAVALAPAPERVAAPAAPGAEPIAALPSSDAARTAAASPPPDAAAPDMPHPPAAAPDTPKPPARHRSREHGIWLATLYNGLLIAAGIGAGIVIGVRQHFTPLQEFFVCAGIGYVLGLYSSVEWLRRVRACTLWCAADASLWPVSVTWITQLLTLAVATRFANTLPFAVGETEIPTAWVVLAAGGVASYILALPSMREALRRTRPPAPPA